MALEKCPECGGMLSSTALSCPHCGWRRGCENCRYYGDFGVDDFIPRCFKGHKELYKCSDYQYFNNRH